VNNVDFNADNCQVFNILLAWWRLVTDKWTDGQTNGAAYSYDLPWIQLRYAVHQNGNSATPPLRQKKK